MTLEELEQLRLGVRQYAMEHAEAPKVREALRTVETAVVRLLGQRLANENRA